MTYRLPYIPGETNVEVIPTPDFSDEAVAFIERNRDCPFFPLPLNAHRFHGPLPMVLSELKWNNVYENGKTLL